MSGWRLNGWLAPWLTLADARPIGPPALDSRRVVAGGVFLACAGTSGHGAQYLDRALAAGAAAIVWEPATGIDQEAIESACSEAGVAAVAMADLRDKAGHLAARYYGYPSEQLWCFGVTGTDGKTSVTQFLARAAGGELGDCGVIGTLGWGWPDDLQASPLTTPDAVTLQGWLAALRDAGASKVAMEVSSHALAQGRVQGVAFDVAILTNLGHDHLDYHGSLAAYRAAKRRLFDTGNPVPVLNLDDDWGLALRDGLAARDPVGYSMGANDDADVWCRRFEPEPAGMGLELVVRDAAVKVRLPLVGRFNAANVLAAAAALLASGVDPADFDERLRRIVPVAGRMEMVPAGNGPTVLVDYAHTPGALVAAMSAVREHCAGSLWVVFGCGGERDRSKRALMGEAAERDADRVVVTSDNPRREDPHRIIDDIRSACSGEVTVVPDRRAAIRHAVCSAAEHDCVLIAGKGHEGYQIIGDREEAFSDRDEARQALGEVA